MKNPRILANPFVNLPLFMAFPGCFIPLSSSQNKGVINTGAAQITFADPANVAPELVQRVEAFTYTLVAPGDRQKAVDESSIR
jgi:hypothetical protein